MRRTPRAVRCYTLAVRMFEIGSSLREARTRQGLEFAEIEARTKIRSKYLRALEDEQFDVLPGAHVRQGLPAHVRRLARAGRRSSTSTSTTPATSQARKRAPLRARARAARPRGAGGASGASRMSSRSRWPRSPLVTALVIAAWKFGGPEPEQVRGLDTAGHGAPAARRRRGGRTVEIRAARGDSFMEVRVGSPRRTAALPRHARARPGPALPTPASDLRLARLAGQRRGQAERQPAYAASAGLRTPREVVASSASGRLQAARPIGDGSSRRGRGRRSSSRAASSSAASAPT